MSSPSLLLLLQSLLWLQTIHGYHGSWPRWTHGLVHCYHCSCPPSTFLISAHTLGNFLLNAVPIALIIQLDLGFSGHLCLEVRKTQTLVFLSYKWTMFILVVWRSLSPSSFHRKYLILSTAPSPSIFVQYQARVLCYLLSVEPKSGVHFSSFSCA